ncbi:MAG: hypothetical protein ACYTG3_08315 [Planctomycetota bacterium]|jgi:hypothetical protein
MKRFAILILLLLASLAPAGDEPKVYVHAPTEDLLSLFPEKGAGFLITIEEYRQLREKALATEAAREEQPPLEGRLVRGTATATIADDILKVNAEYAAVVKGDRPAAIPFPLSGIALESLAGGELAGGSLRFDKAGTYPLQATLSARLHKEGDVTRAAFRLPPATAHTVTLALPPEVEGEVGPIVRAFRSGAQGGTVTGYPDETGLFTLWFKPRAPARRLDALLSVQFETLAEIGEARTTTRSAVGIDVLRAPVDGVTLQLDPGQIVRALTGKGVKSWRLVRGTPDRLEIRFVEPLQRPLALSLETELPREAGPQVRIPVLRVAGAVRYRGEIGIVARPEVRLTGLQAAGARRLDETPKGGLALFQVWSPTGRIDATVERVAAKTRAVTQALLMFREGGKSFAARFTYTIAGQPLFRLEPALPRGWILRRARLDGRDVAHRWEEADGRLTLDFAQGLKPGTHVLEVLLDTDEVDWVPNEGPAAFELAGVRSGLDEESGLLVVASDTAFSVSATATNGLETVGMDHVARGLGNLSDRMLYAWRFERPDYAAAFSLERHTPQLTATVVNRLYPSERLLKVHATLAVDIQRAGVRELKVALPKGTGKLVDFAGPLIKEKRAPDEGADPETWTVVFQKRIRGVYRLEVVFDKKFQEDAWHADAPEISVPGAQEHGFVVVHSGGTTALTVEREGLREADVGELPAPPQRPPLEVLAYARHPYRVKLSSRRHDPEAVLQAIALSAHIYGVVTGEGHLRCRAEYRIRNNDQPFLKFGLPQGSQLIGVLVDGRPSKPLIEEGQLQLSLPRSRNRETPFVVAIVYETDVEPLERSGKLTVDRPALDIDVLETRYTLHLPRGYTLTDHDGDLVPLDVKQRETVLADLGERMPSWPTFGMAREASDMAGPPASVAVEDREVADLRRQVQELDFWLAQYRKRYGDVSGGGGGGGAGAAPSRDAAKAVQLRRYLATKDGTADFEKLQREIAAARKSVQDQDLKARLYSIEAQLREREHRVTANLEMPEAEMEEAEPAAEKSVADELMDKSETRNSRFKNLPDTVQKELKRAEKKSKQPAARKARRRPRAKSAEPPGARTPSDPEPPPPAPTADMPAGGKFVAHGGRRPAPTKPTPQPPQRRQRPERALLSLDVQFLRPDNLYRLDSLAPSGRVTLKYARVEVYDRHHYLGFVLGAAAFLGFLLVRRHSLLRLLPAAVLAVVALHFAGLSFLPGDFARGAGQAIALLLVLVLIWRMRGPLEAIGRRARRIRFRKAAAPLLLLGVLGAYAEAGDEVWVPYKDEPGKIDRVFLPAKEYHRLRRLAYPETAGRATAFMRAEYAAALKGEDLTVSAVYEIVKETEDAERLPLGLHEVAVTRAQLDGRPANLTIKKGGYVLVLAGKGRFNLELELRPRLDKSGEARSFRFPVRPVADAKLALTHDREGHDVKVVGLGGKADTLHHLGPVAVVGATWTPRTEGFAAAAAELRARTEALVSVRDGFTAVAARILYGISGGKADRFRVRVGRDLTVREVRCPDLAGWQIEGGDLVVALTKPADKALALEIFAERPAEQERTESVPEIAPLGVLRDAGVLALETLPDLKLEILDSAGLLRGLAGQAPKKLTAAPDPGTLHSVHRFAVRPFALSWRVFLERTRLRVQTDLDLLVGREAATAQAMLKVEVERGPGPFSIPVTVPAGYEVVTVRGPVRDWWVKENRLTIARPNRQRGGAAYQVFLRRRGATAEAFAAPTLAVPDAVRETGLVRVAVADGLELETGETTNLLPEDVAKVGRAARGRLVRAYRFYAPEWRLELSTREEAREVEALVVSRVVPLADRVLVEAVIDFHVRRGLVDTLSFIVPVEEEGEALVNAADRREVSSEQVEGGRRFTVTLRTPTRGSTTVTVSYTAPTEASLRGVEPQGAARVRRYVAVEKVPDGQVRVTEVENLEPAEFEDLPLHPPETTAQTVARVLVGSGGPFRLTLDVKRHAFEEVAKAVIYRAGAQAVVDRSGWVRVLVSYRVYNRSEQFLRLALPADATLYSVFVAGEGVRPLGEGTDLLIPLRKLALGSPTFDVDVVYAYAGPRIGTRDFATHLPEVKELDVRRTTLSLYVPKGYDYSFETEMEEAEAADIAAGEATDLYEEIKELYGVAQRGNELQAGRALSNLQQLEQESQRLNDYLRSNIRDRDTLAQIDSQERALGALRRTQTARGLEPQAQQAGLGKGRGAYEWEVNREFLRRGQDAARQQVEEYQSKQQALSKLDDVTAGLDDQADAPFLGDAASLGLLFDTRRDEDGGEGQGEGGAGGWVASLGKAADKKPSAVARGYLFEDADGDGKADLKVPTQLQAAKGRISLRIDLPLKGEVFHFAYLGREGGVTFAATEDDRRLLDGLIALACAGAVVFILRYRMT